jgi:hypothetical protein
MLRVHRFALAIALCSLLTGCTKQTEPVDVATNTTEVVATSGDATTEQGVHYDIFENNPVVFDSNVQIPIMKDSQISGWLNINYVEKLGIWDINNKSATDNGVKFSYAINYSIDLTEYLEANELIEVKVTPKLYDNANNLVGSVGYVGWSGFTDTVSLYKSKASGYAEVVLQPYDKDINNYKSLVLEIADLNGEVQFDDVYIDVGCLLNAKDGPSIMTLDDTATIESINGAIYTISFRDVYYELNDVSNTKLGDDKMDYFYDFTCIVSYKQQPTNDIEVTTFDSFNNFAMIKMPLIEVFSDTDSTKLYNVVEGVKRYVYSDSNDLEEYLTEFPSALDVGYRAIVSQNRIVPETTVEEPTYIRIVLQFPEEIKSRSYSEISEFSGRYLVWQLPLSTRSLEAKPK